MKWNPRFVAYATTHKRTPEVQLEQDKVEYPGGCMCGFILWIEEQKRAFYKVCPEAFLDSHTITDYKAWDKFLNVKA